MISPDIHARQKLPEIILANSGRLFKTLCNPLYGRLNSIHLPAAEADKNQSPIVGRSPGKFIWMRFFAYSWKLRAYSGAFYLQLTILAFLLTIGACCLPF